MKLQIVMVLLFISGSIFGNDKLKKLRNSAKELSYTYQQIVASEPTNISKLTKIVNELTKVQKQIVKHSSCKKIGIRKNAQVCTMRELEDHNCSEENDNEHEKPYWFLYDDK